MMEKSKSKINVFTIFLLVITGSLAVISGVFYNRYQTGKKEMAGLRIALSGEKEDSALFYYQKLLEADGALLTGNDREALEAYRNLGISGIALIDSVIEHRIRVVKTKERRSQRDTLEVQVAAVSPGLVDSTGLLNPGADSIRISHKNTTDSLSNRITELSRQVRDRNRALQEKEKRELKIFQNMEGASIHYIGEIKNDMANGEGTGMWENSGGVYKGQWVDNQRHGYGVYTWSDGVRYEGAFVRDKREGKGTYTWVSGERYEGEWKNNKRHGKGVLYDKDGNVSYRGGWEDDKPQRNENSK